MDNRRSRKVISTEDETAEITHYPTSFSGKIKFENLLGKGSSLVYRGTYEYKAVAVKKLELKQSPFAEDVISKIKLHHQNVVQILSVEHDTDVG